MLIVISKIDHIGVAVQSIKAHRALYQDVLGLPITATEIVAEQKVKVAFIPVGDNKIELLESINPDGPIAKFIAARGEGVQHTYLRIDMFFDDVLIVNFLNIYPAMCRGN